jgi:hypothetical protein
VKGATSRRDGRDLAAITARHSRQQCGCELHRRTERLSFRAADAILAPTLHGAMYCTLAAGKRWIAAGLSGVVPSMLSTSTITGRA